MTPISTRNGTVLAFAAVVLLTAALILATTAVVGSHYESSAGESGDITDFTVHTYGGAAADARAPGASDVSYWTESTIHELPDGESVYLLESVTYRPIPSSCNPGTTDEFGVDRGGTAAGDRHVDDDAMASVKSFSHERDVADQWEREGAESGALTTADVDYVERIEVAWYGPRDFGTPLRVENGDRFVTAQRSCHENPDAAGWYRWAAFNRGETDDGTAITQTEPTFSHWYWICACEDREMAYAVLGPPPSEQNASTTIGGSDDSPSESTTPNGGSGDDPNASDRTTTPAYTGPSTPTERSPIEPPTATATPEAASAWDEHVVRTPTVAQGDGPDPIVALTILVVLSGCGIRR